MNSIFSLHLTRLPLTLALTGLTFSAAGETVSAVESIPATGSAPQVIRLPTSNSAASSVTIWKSLRAARSSGATTSPKDWAPRVIQLHAPNNPTPSITVWSSK